MMTTGKLTHSERFEAYLIGLAVEAPDQMASYRAKTPEKKIEEWKAYSVKIFIAAGMINARLEKTEKGRKSKYDHT